MAWLTVTILVSLAALAFVLLAPVRVRLLLAPDRKQISLLYLGFEITWDQRARRTDLLFFGLQFGSHTRHSPISPEIAASPVSERDERVPASQNASPSFPRRVRLLWSSRLTLRRATVVLARLLGRLWRSWRLESGRVNLVLGLSDPALTGFATGLFWTLRPVIRRRWPMLAVNCTPVFDPGAGSAFGANVDLVYRIVPFEPIWALVRAVSSLPWRSLVRLRRAWAL